MPRRIPRYTIAFFSKNQPVFYGLLFLVVAFIPLYTFLGDFHAVFVQISILSMLYIVLALGLNIIPGFTGLLDLGFVGFYAIGAYTAGLLTLKCSAMGPPWDILSNYWVIIPLAALNGALWGILLGAPTLRLTGDYFAIVTFGFSELVVLVIVNEMWLTRGPMGLPGISSPGIDLTFLYPITRFFFENPIVYSFKGKVPFFYLILFMMIATIFVMNRLEDSRLGRAWFAIRDDEIAAECSGINIMRYKVIAFAISASFGAIGGSFFARWFGFISPVSFKFWESILILCMVVLGGMGSIPGVILGATVLVSLSEILRQVLQPWPDLVQARYALFGILLIFMMRFKPAGLIPLSRVKRVMSTKDESILQTMNESFFSVSTDKKKLSKDR
jgi:branched-chain amino acid transport system permease protein